MAAAPACSYPMSAPIFKTSRPLTPWQGAFFEQLIGCVKRTLAITLRGRHLQRTLFLSLITAAEAAVNSRPLCPAPEEEGEALTPAHFLVGRRILSIPPVTYTDSGPRSASAREYQDQLIFHDKLWKRFQLEYLTTLRNRWLHRAGPT